MEQIADLTIEPMAPRQYDLPIFQAQLENLTSIAVPFAGTIKNNETVKIECVDWTGGQIKNNDSADDIRDVDLTKVHYLSGPFEIETAEPGDVLVVDIQDVQPLEDSPWGFTGIFAKNNGGGFLDEIYPKPYVLCEMLGLGMNLILTKTPGQKPFGTLRESTARPATSLVSSSLGLSTLVF